jgi:hypothetical protein
MVGDRLNTHLKSEFNPYFFSEQGDHTVKNLFVSGFRIKMTNKREWGIPLKTRFLCFTLTY